MKKTKWTAMAAALLFLGSAYLGTSPALARYLNSEQLFTAYTAENRSLTVKVGQTDAGNFLTSDGAAFLVTGAANGTLPFTFTNDGSDAKVIRVTSTTALGAESVFILNPQASDDPDKIITDPVVSGSVSKYTQTHTVNWTLATGTYTVTIEVFDAADVKITGAKNDATDPENPENPDNSGDSDNSGDNTGGNTGDNSGDTGDTGDNSGDTGDNSGDTGDNSGSAETENTTSTQSAETAASVTAEDGEGNDSVNNSENSGDSGSGEGEGDTTPTTPTDPITPAGDSNSSIEEGSAVPYITLRAVFIVQTGESASAVTVAPILTVTGSGYSVSGTNPLAVTADTAVSGFSYSVQRYAEVEQDAKDDIGKDIKVKVLQWQTIELTAPTDGTTEIPVIEGFTADLKGKTLTLTNAESKAPAGLYRLVINLDGAESFPLYVPFLVNYRQPLPPVEPTEDLPTVGS